MNPQANEIQTKVMQVVRTSFDHIVGETDEEKKEWCADQLTDILESVDNLIPIVGAIIDIPFVDQMEKDAIRMLVDWGFKKFHHSG